MTNTIIKYLKSSISISILLIIFSFFLIFAPEASISLIMRILGIILLFTGVLHIINYFSEFKEFKTISVNLIIGVLTFVIGLTIILKPLIINELLTLLVGAWIIIESIIKFQISLKTKMLELSYWKYPLISSIFTFILGFTILINPFSTIFIITTICGIILLISQLICLSQNIYMLKSVK